MSTTRSTSTDEELSPTLRARMDRTPLLTPDAEAALFRSIRRAHDAAWAAVRAEGPMVDARLGDSDWSALRAAQVAALAVAKRMINLRGAQHVERRGAGRAWWVAVDDARAALDALAEKAVEANLRLCVHEARRHHRNRLSLNDRVQAACMGCMHAAKNFDPERGFRFSTFATHWLRHAIQRAEQDTGATIRIPVHIQETRGAVLKAVARLTADAGGAPPTAAEVCAASGRTVIQLRNVARLPRVESADAPIGTATGTANQRTLLDTVPDASCADPIEALDAPRNAAAIARALDFLPPTIGEVLRRRFGLGTGPGEECEVETLRAIGERLSLSRERIRQLEVEGVRRLRVLVPALLTPPARRTHRQIAAVDHCAAV